VKDPAPILLVDDEPQMLLAVSMTLELAGFVNIETCATGEEALERLEATPFAALFLDMLMPGLSGHALLENVVRRFPGLPVIMLTAVNELEVAVSFMQQGAFDYLVKPVDATRLVTSAKRALERFRIQAENERLRTYLLSDHLEQPEVFASIVSRDPAIRALCQYIEAVSRSAMPVLITGETGVGKELFARAVHDSSGRSGEFVAVNVAGLDDSLFSDTLFGHERGSFTGAVGSRAGLIERAQGGTLFLDEIGNLAPQSQVKLLRLLQEGEYYAIGDDRPRQSDARVVAATLEDLEAGQRDGHFRKDLYYRLQTHHVKIPPLRERKGDLALLTASFLASAARRLDKPVPTVPAELQVLLENYPFPGNVRELEAMIYDALTVHKGGVLSTQSFRAKIGLSRSPTGETSSAPLSFPEPLPGLKELEDSLIAEALRRAQGNQRIAAEMLGLSRRALNNRLSRR